MHDHRLDARLSRRALMLSSAAAVLAACSPRSEAPTAAADPALVPTEYGPLRGVLEDGVYEFRGVRYAQAPVGALRFQAPRKPEPWAGVTPEVAATAYGNAAVQMRSGAGAAAYPPLVQAAMTEAFRPPEGLKAEGDEDCLFLNVYTPAAGPGSGRRPVMVWLHGGGFSYGQAALNIYRGHNLAKNHDVVMVGINHRLNVFGFLALDSAGIPGFAGSANAGMLDIVMALEWVRDNIANFGGDPGNVTLFGQSGGGAKVSTLMAMPAARGLFHKAIVQSGAGLRAIEKEDAAVTVSSFILGLGISASIAAETLQTMSTEDILDVAREIGVGEFRPSIDDVTLMRHPFDPDAPEMAADIPLLIGFTKDEQTLYNVGDPDWMKTTEADVLAAAERAAPGKARELVAAFREAFPDYDPPHLKMQVTGTANSLRSHHLLASRKSAQAAPVFAYVFAHDLPPQDFILKSPHTAEIPYIMDTVDEAPLFAGASAADLALGTQLSTAWTTFARTGVPAAPGLPEWPRFDAATRSTLFLDTAPRVVERPFEAAWLLVRDRQDPR
jgi:para-nitrobenzyl esterase